MVNAHPAGDKFRRRALKLLDLQEQLVGVPFIIVITKGDQATVAGGESGIAGARQPWSAAVGNQAEPTPGRQPYGQGGTGLWSNTTTHSRSPG
jgi:hypothetical protein